MPSDHFGDDFELNEAMKTKLRNERKWSKEIFDKSYSNFSKKFASQKCFSKHTKTDLNIFFCDYVLFSNRQIGASADNYFDFEFYNKSFDIRNTFRTGHRSYLTQLTCNDFFARELLLNKPKTDKIFNSFLHRDWLDTCTCTFEEFKIFVEKHPRFFSKPVDGLQGIGAAIINVYSDENLEELFANLKRRRRLLEEVVKQHKEIAAFCPDTINTIRVCTILDIHNVVHILTTNGRFGRVGKVIDNLHGGGGYAVAIDPKTGIIISDAINGSHERVEKHPDTGKTFKGFQYPCWEKMRETVTQMAKLIPQMRHVGWDISINDNCDAVIIEANGDSPAEDLQQSPDDKGRHYLYTPLLDELKSYKWEQMKLLGYKVNNLPNFDSTYDIASRNDLRLKLAIDKMLPECKSLIDLGCRKSKVVKSLCPKSVKYYPVDFQKHDEEVIACNFNKGEFPDIKADAIVCAFTAEYVEHLPQFLADMCNAANKQILMWCRPMSEQEITNGYRWSHPFLVDFTEKFLTDTMSKNNFQLVAKYPASNTPAIILYDFRKNLNK